MFDSVVFQGNYENKFTIDEESGEISVVEPLKQRDGRTGRSLSEIEPVITLQVIIRILLQTWAHLLPDYT